MGEMNISWLASSVDDSFDALLAPVLRFPVEENFRKCDFTFQAQLGWVQISEKFISIQTFVFSSPPLAGFRQTGTKTNKNFSTKYANFSIFCLFFCDVHGYL